MGNEAQYTVAAANVSKMLVEHCFSTKKTNAVMRLSVAQKIVSV